MPGSLQRVGLKFWPHFFKDLIQAWCSKVVNELSAVAATAVKLATSFSARRRLSHFKTIATLKLFCQYHFCFNFWKLFNPQRPNGKLFWFGCVDCLNGLKVEFIMFRCHYGMETIFCHRQVSCFQFSFVALETSGQLSTFCLCLAFQKKDQDQQQMRQKKFHDKDSEVTVTDLWMTWWKGEVHNWWVAPPQPGHPSLPVAVVVAVVSESGGIRSRSKRVEPILSEPEQPKMLLSKLPLNWFKLTSWFERPFLGYFDGLLLR